MPLAAFDCDECESPAVESEFDSRTAAINGALDKSSVAELSGAVLAEMTPKELITVIQAADFPGFADSNINRHPDQYDRQTLLRLANIARRSCRYQGY